MHKSRNMNVLLIEILIAVLFFAIAATVILEMYAGAYALGRRAKRRDAAMRKAQNTAELLWSVENPYETLFLQGYQPGEDDHSAVFSGEGYTLEVDWHTQQRESGFMQQRSVLVYVEDELLAELPCGRYVPRPAREG